MSRRLAIYCPSLGNISETFIRRQIRQLLPGRCVVITSDAGGGAALDLPVFEVPRPRGVAGRKLLAGARRFRLGWSERHGFDRAGAFLEEHRVAVILGNFLHCSWPLIDLARGRGIRFIGHAHGCDMSACYHQAHWRARYRDYRHAAGVVVVNEIMRRRLIRVGVPARKIHLVPYGVDMPARCPERPAGRRVRCLAVGRMVAKKAPLKILEAFKLASERQPDLRLDYIGDGPLFPLARTFVDRHQLFDRVTLHGAREHRFVLDTMERADLFIQHSIVDPETRDEEGLPVAILEAMARGLTVVSTRHAGIPEAVQQGETGFLVNEGAARSMGGRIAELAADAELRAAMGKAAWARARERYAWPVEKSKLLGILEVPQ